ncbi:MAG: FtsX-like permease family protein, partial [Firmicutes bacterium]|nr:FtsX-like permease family protein [Bacillota bacterium]
FFADSMFTSLREQHYSRLGEQDAIIFNCGGAPLEKLVTGGIFTEYGVAEILGCVLPDGESENNSFSIARFDDTALALTRKETLAGRLPEKAGEIALERSTLARLRSEAAVGDRITLTLLIPDGSIFLDTPVEKSYTLVGILTDKLIYLEQWRHMSEAPSYTMGSFGHPDYPAGVLAADEQIEPGGRALVNCYGLCAGGATTSFEQLHEFLLDQGEPADRDWWLKLEQTSYRPFAGYFGGSDGGIAATSIFFTIIALVLLCAACMGVISAFSADLESRKRQIGLFRALGATQKQIRAIYGREATLLALCAIPAGLALAAMTIRGIVPALGESYTFRPNALVIAAVAAAGLLCVRAAAAIPLRKAARISPMQAIRDVEITRRLRRSRIQSISVFNVPRHIARRSLTLYRNRQLGITVMLASSIILFSVAAFGARPLLEAALHTDYVSDYVIQPRGGPMLDWLMESGIHRPGITEQDRADAAALAGVERVTGARSLGIKILPRAITSYMIDSRYGRFDYLSPGRLTPDGQDDTTAGSWLALQHRDYLASKGKYGYSRDYLSIHCHSIDAEIMEKLGPFVSAGKINIDKLNSGEEILVVAPAKYGLVQDRWTDGNGPAVLWSVDYALDPKTTYSTIHENDMFRAGDSLDLSLLYSNDPPGPGGLQEYSDDGSRILPDNVVRIDREVTIGALLEVQGGREQLYNQISFYCEAGDILTTNAGLSALGFEAPYRSLGIILSESPDAALEEYLETNLELIAARNAEVEVWSHVAMARESRRIASGLLITAGAILLLLFAGCAGMINNALSARIRSGRREIGTLRAVGASGKVIARSYLWQLLSTFAWGAAAGYAGGLALCGYLLWKEIVRRDLFSLQLWPPLLFVALLFGICLLNINSKVGAVCKESITENIREL